MTMTAPLVAPPNGRMPTTGCDSRRIRVRTLRATDGPRHEAFVRGLSAETLYNRMLGAGMAVTPEGLQRLVNVDQRTHIALAAVVRENGAERIVGVARYALEADPGFAELAVTVDDAWQGCGVGRRLLTALIRRARAARVTCLFGDCFPSNTAMLSLLRNSGFSIASTPGDAHLTRGTRLLAVPRRGRGRAPVPA
jgi:acetyltransferase